MTNANGLKPPRQYFPIDQIQAELAVLKQLAIAEAVQLHWREAQIILLRAEALAVYPHDIKNLFMMRQEYAEQACWWPENKL